ASDGNVARSGRTARHRRRSAARQLSARHSLLRHQFRTARDHRHHSVHGEQPHVQHLVEEPDLVILLKSNLDSRCELMKRPHVARAHATAGFTLVETLVAVTVVSLIMGAAFMALTSATRLSENARRMTGVNANLRGAMDAIVRDLSQAGRDLPGLRRVG